MRNIRLTIIICVVSVLVLSCTSSLKVITENRAPEKISGYQSFTFAEDYDAASPNFTFAPFEKEQIRYFISEELAAKKFDETEESDLTIKVLGKIANVQELRNTTDPYYNSWDWYNRGRYYSNRRGQMQKKITLIIDIYDSKTDKLVWHGEAFDDLDRKDATEEKLEEIIKAILKDLPEKS